MVGFILVFIAFNFWRGFIFLFPSFYLLFILTILPCFWLYGSLFSLSLPSFINTSFSLLLWCVCRLVSLLFLSVVLGFTLSFIVRCWVSVLLLLSIWLLIFLFKFFSWLWGKFFSLRLEAPCTEHFLKLHWAGCPKVVLVYICYLRIIVFVSSC